MNIEAALITKVIEEKAITKAINSKVSRTIRIYVDVWTFIEDFYFRYKAVPDFEAIQKKFPDFEPVKTDYTIEYLIDQVNDEFIRSKLEELLINSSNMIDDDPRSTLEYILSKTSSIIHSADVVKDVDLSTDYWLRANSLRERYAIAESGNKILGIPSDIPQIDLIFGGWQKGDFVVLMGWTAAGKSWLAVNFATTAWRHGYKPLYVSIEMDDIQLGYRVDTLLGRGAFSNTSLMNARHVDIDSYESWLKANFKDKHPFYIVTNEGMDEITQFTIQAKIEQYKPDIVFIDYHSLCEDARRGRSETEKHKNLSKDFKRMAVRFGIPIIDIVAVTMEDGHETRPPELNEVAWSKQLAYDADLVLSLFKVGQQMTVESKKSRRSELFAFKLEWDFDSGNYSVVNW